MSKVRNPKLALALVLITGSLRPCVAILLISFFASSVSLAQPSGR